MFTYTGGRGTTCNLYELACLQVSGKYLLPVKIELRALRMPGKCLLEIHPSVVDGQTLQLPLLIHTGGLVIGICHFSVFKIV